MDHPEIKTDQSGTSDQSLRHPKNMMQQDTIDPLPDRYPPHPRTMGWLGTTALAMGGSNQMVFLIGALIAGQGAIPGQGSAAVICLIVGLILSWMAAPGWTE